LDRSAPPIFLSLARDRRHRDWIWLSARKKPDEWGAPIAAYDPYGPGTGVAGDDDFVAGDETGVAGDAGA
jgi:hypothetical protein